MSQPGISVLGTRVYGGSGVFPVSRRDYMEIIAFIMALTGLEWLLFAAMVFLVIFALEFENDAGIIFTLLLWGVGAWYLGGHETPTLLTAWHWLDANFLRILAYLGSYLVIGAVWSLVKWYFYVHNVADAYEHMRESYQNRYAQYAAETETRKQAVRPYLTWLSDEVYGSQFPPNPRKNKHRITQWFVYWPWSALWTLTNDPVRRIAKFVYTHLSGTMTAISQHVFGSRFEEFKA